MSNFNEDVVEQATLAWLEGLGYEILFGPDIAPGESAAERDDYREVLLLKRLRDSLARLNPNASPDALEAAYNRVRQISEPSLPHANRAFHRLLVNGVEVETLKDGVVGGERLALLDFETPENNDWLAVNQYTVVEGQVERRPDVVIFLNGLPVAVIELKNTRDEDATIWTAYDQLQTYQMQMKGLFVYNELLVISDGFEARLGALGATQERFQPWKTVTGDELALATDNQLSVLLRGVFEKTRLLEFLRHFIIFEDDGRDLIKKIAAYHQFYAVKKAMTEVLRASSQDGNRRGGVVWHTQGSGKSLTMLFFAGKLILHPEMENPTIVMLTDRIDLDNQLFGTFARCRDILRQAPEQADTRAELRSLLTTSAGGVVFTTIQKFSPDEKGDIHPELSDRANIVVIADEAHRSQYDFMDGYARHIHDALPHATFVGFTGTPLELADRDTRLVFGDYIDIYDVQRSVDDKATVPIYYENRLAKLQLDEAQRPVIDETFDDITESQEDRQKEKLKSTWTRLEQLVGTQKRLEQIAKDMLEHFEKRQGVLEGKGMVVCMSRRICVDLYNEIIKLRPDWHSDDDKHGAVKIIMTGAAPDPKDWQTHIRNKARREDLANRFKNPSDAFKLVIVRDMWLTGFDVPSLHTMYIDKPMKGHSLMQAIARVNRVFRDKPGGLVVDYLGLANNLKEALAVYADNRGKGKPINLDPNEVTAQLLERLEQCRGFFFSFDYDDFLKGSPTERLAVIPKAQEHLLIQNIREPGSLPRFLDVSLALSKAFALAGASDEAKKVRNEVIFFQTIRAVLSKTSAPSPKAQRDLDHAIRQLVDQAVAPEGVVDIFAAAGLEKPDISILSDGFLADVRDMPQRNLAVELLDKLLNDEVKSKSRKNLVQSKVFSEKLKESLQKYHNRAVETAQVIEELIQLAKEFREARSRGDDLGLSDEELAFYDALEVNDSAVAVMGDAALRDIAKELATTVRNNANIDWSVRESVRANMRRMVKRVLRKHGYPPDKQEKATQTVVEQAQLFSATWRM